MNTRRAVTVVALIQILLVLALPASAQETARSGADCSLTTTGTVPLTELGTAAYMGEQGGLYPGGSNEIPADHETLGLWHASQIAPLDTAGNPDPDGSIVLLSIGVSNTRSEFGMFLRRVGDAVDDDVVLVNGAQPGEDISAWQSVDDPTWRAIDGALAQNEVSPEQVQAVWIKLPDIVEGTFEILPFPADADAYRDQLAVVVQNAMDLYPNLRLAYLSSRIYAGYNTSGRPSPEPLAYENAFGVKWLIADQIEGDITLNADPRRGDVEAPWLAWGPYLWADGTTPRSDGLVWECADLQDDGIHPSQSGAVKVADMLVDHFETSSTSSAWFSGDGVAIGEVVLPEPVPAPATTTTVVETTTTTSAPESTTTVEPQTGSDRPGPPDRAERDQDRAARQAEDVDGGSNEALLIGTAVALALILGAVGLVGWLRRRPSPEAEDDT